MNIDKNIRLMTVRNRTLFVVFDLNQDENGTHWSCFILCASSLFSTEESNENILIKLLKIVKYRKVILLRKNRATPVFQFRRRILPCAVLDTGINAMGGMSPGSPSFQWWLCPAPSLNLPGTGVMCSLS